MAHDLSGVGKWPVAVDIRLALEVEQPIPEGQHEIAERNEAIRSGRAAGAPRTSTFRR
ncbi:MAG TPA: hypothetical protein VF756_26320 [Thermoanaerobaculia bacterium]